ncbi:MAG: glycosyltransferase family 39 protein [Planctomycetes bacterium]|nr:glycosyltransferase family 39 protein [Planctomycetota bacterium]
MSSQLQPVAQLGTLLSRASGSFPASHLWCTRVFWAWLVVRTVAWICLTTATLANPPLDLVEWLSWGHSLQMGYPKHPPLPAWLAAGFARLSPGDVWGVYVLAYLTAAACIWAAWKLALEYLPPPQALLAALCLEGSLYLTCDPAEWSNNVALDLGWACIILFGYHAVRTGSTRWWAAVGLAIGLTLLCKYTVGVLLIPMTAYLILDPHARRNLRRPGPYVAVGVAIAVFAPHLVWLVQNEFITLTYASDRTADTRWYRRVWNPTEFTLGQAYHILPMLVILFPGLGRRSTPRTAEEVSRSRFLHAAILGPVALLYVISVATGCVLREIWGSPLWTFLGVWVLVNFRGTATDLTALRIMRRVLVVSCLMMVFSVITVELRPYVERLPSRQQFPGRQLTTEVNRRWNTQFSEPFPIVAGEAWAAGNVCCFSRHRPVLYSSGAMGYLVFESKATPWTNDDDLNKRGGVVLWDAVQLGDDVPMILRDRLPRAVGQPPIDLRYHTSATVPTARIGVAFVPPSH